MPCFVDSTARPPLSRYGNQVIMPAIKFAESESWNIRPEPHCPWLIIFRMQEQPAGTSMGRTSVEQQWNQLTCTPEGRSEPLGL